MEPLSPVNPKRNMTPPPAYSQSSEGPSSLSEPQGGTGFDPYNSVNYNPWAAVPTPTHPSPHPNAGPTPASALQIPYAYYDPRSAYSLAEADARGRRRFWLSLLWALVLWFAFWLVVSWIVERSAAWFHEGVGW